MKYFYSVVRFVPDPARGEFINVGAVAGSEDASDWEIRQIDNPSRARAIDSNQSLTAAFELINRVGQFIDAFKKTRGDLFHGTSPVPGERWLESLHAQHRNVVQLTPPAPMIADSADEALNIIFENLIVDPAQKRFPFKKKHVAMAAVRESYRKNLIVSGENLWERVVVKTAKYIEPFDFAVVNGRALQLTQTWSFQVPDQEAIAEEVKAWGWAVRDLQQNGARVVSVDRDREVKQDADIQVVYVRPEQGAKSTLAMDQALNVFRDLKITHTPYETVNVGAPAHQMLVKSGVRLT